VSGNVALASVAARLERGLSQSPYTPDGRAHVTRKLAWNMDDAAKATHGSAGPDDVT
jgi:hypothetical protein